jgi:multidrug efflux pump
LLETVAQFEDLLLVADQAGGQVKLGDVARIEISAENYRVIGRYNGNPASGIAIELAPGANALETIQAVKDRVKDFDTIIPDDLAIVYPVDISLFIEASINEVVKTLVIAIVLKLRAAP